MSLGFDSIAETVRSFVSSRSRSRRRLKRQRIRPAGRSRFCAEGLEGRIFLSVVPAPIIPSTGDANQLLQAVKHAAQNNQNALDNDPVPFSIQFSGGTAAPQVVNWHAGAPIKLNVDNNGVTGNGGNDIQVDVETVLLPTPHLTMQINRLAGPFATNVNVLVAFPFNAFNSEILPSGVPNLILGYQTTATGGAVGGSAPATELITFTPHILGGTNHLFDLNFATTGSLNPLTFETGEFDGTNLTGALNARVIATHVENVPTTINVGLNVAQSALATLPSAGSIGITWDASAQSPVTFGYLEDISAPTSLADFNTTLTFNQMPTHEQISLGINEAARTITISHLANSIIGAITFQTTRSDGLTITGTAANVPTALDVTVGTQGTVSLNTHGSTLGGLTITGTQTGGFFNTAGFLGYNLGYVQLVMTDVPSLTAGYLPVTDSFGAQVTVPGTSIGSVGMVISKDAASLQLPPSGLWANTAWDIFSLIDDGTKGTAAARMAHISTATFSTNPASISDIFHLVTTAPAPMEAYLRTKTTSNIIPGHDVEVTADIVSFPAGTIDVAANFPLIGYVTNPPQTISSIHVFGHIDSLFFDIDAGDLPPVFAVDFDPDTHATIKAENGLGGSATVGHIAVHFWNPNLTGLTGSGFLFGTPLNDAEIRFDHIPSLHATWTNAASTTVNFTPDVAGFFIDGAQLAVSTKFDLAALPAASASAADHVDLLDLGAGAEKQLATGAFGVSSVALSTDDANHKFHLNYVANAAHVLNVNFNSSQGGRYFAPFDVHEHLGLSAIPGSFDVLTDLATTFVYTATGAIASLGLTGSFGNAAIGTINTMFLATALPATLDFEYPGSKATLDMSGPIGHLGFALTNDTHGMFGTPYRLVAATMDSIPAHWIVDWSGGGLLVQATDASNNPAPMGVVAATVSTSTSVADNNAFLHPFQISGPSGARINYSSFLQTIDTRYFNAAPGGAAATLAALDAIYNGAHVLGAGEDHAVAQVNGGSLAFFDGQFTGFQKIAYQPNANGGHYEFDAPTPGVHPFFAGVGLDSNFLYASIDNIPDSATLDIDTAADNIHFHTSSDYSVTPTSAVGNIDVYYGPQGMAQDADTALRAIMQNVPNDVLITWGFGFPTGAANFTASNPFTLLMLAQDGSHRLVGGLRLQELEVGYDVKILPLDFDIGTTYGIPTSLNLVLLEAKAGIDNDTADQAIAGNPAKPGVDGFFNLYSMTSSPSALTPAGPAPAANEYTPELTFMMKNFTEFSIDMKLEVGIFPDFLSPSVNVTKTITGQFALDFWAPDVELTSSFLGFDFGFSNPPDYTDNTPIHLIPLGSPQFSVLHDAVFTFLGFSDFTSHFDPLS